MPGILQRTAGFVLYEVDGHCFIVNVPQGQSDLSSPEAGASEIGIEDVLPYLHLELWTAPHPGRSLCTWDSQTH